MSKKQLKKRYFFVIF